MAKAAILGFGTVGSGAAHMLTANADRMTAAAGTDIELKYIVDVRDFPGSPFEKYLTKDFSVVENDPEVSVIIETIGGTRVAYDFTRRALLAGKSVVTSNKELVATYGPELLEIAAEKGVSYLFEASVGGGVPIIKGIEKCLWANRINSVSGILNGTTNYILTKMISGNASFDDALKQAQAHGYAEANPTADIEGLDACRKVCILAAVAFGVHIDPQAIPTRGISSVTLQDARFAGERGYAVKLLGRTCLVSGRIAAYVEPHLVPSGSILHGVNGVMNGIAVSCDAVGDVMFYGPGAGRLETASAIASDVIDAVRGGNGLRWREAGKDDAFDAGLIKSRWYVRAPAASIMPDGFEIIAGDGTQTAYFSAPLDRYEIEKALDGKNALSLFRIMD